MKGISLRQPRLLYELFKARPVQFGALPAAAEQLFTKPQSRPRTCCSF